MFNENFSPHLIVELKKKRKKVPSKTFSEKKSIDSKPSTVVFHLSWLNSQQSRSEWWILIRMKSKWSERGWEHREKYWRRASEIVGANTAINMKLLQGTFNIFTQKNKKRKRGKKTTQEQNFLQAFLLFFVAFLRVWGVWGGLKRKDERL